MLAWATELLIAQLGTLASLAASAVIGFAISYYFFWKQKQKRQLSYTCIYGDLFTDLARANVNYDFRWGPFSIKNPYLVRVIMWNDGNETITHADLSKTDPLHITITDSFILAARWKHTSSIATIPRIRIDENRGQIALSFEFLEPKSGFVLDAVVDYKGAGSPERPIAFVSGAVKGSKVERRYTPSGFSSKRYYFISAAVFSSAILALFGLVPVVGLFSDVDDNVEAIAATVIAMGTLLVAPFLFVIAWALWPRMRYPEMVGTTKEKVGEIGALSLQEKWQVASSSLQMYAANEKAARGPHTEMTLAENDERLV